MFEHLKVTNHLVIKEARLTNLGQINVVCGKNNSGKSTLLKEIKLNQKFEVGKFLSLEDIQLILQYLRNSIPDPYLTNILRHLEPNKELIKKFETKVLFRSEIEQCLEDVESYLNENDENYLVSHEAYRIKTPIRSAIINIFDRFNPVIPEIIEIPAKRQLTIGVSINTNEKADPYGGGILNRLFYSQNKVNEKTKIDFYSKIDSAFYEISSGYRFKIIPQENSTISLFFDFKGNTNWIPADSCGLGLRDLLIILYFALESSSRVVLIEEPENHIHPEMQRKLLRFLKEETDKQYFIATHSNIFLDPTYVDRVFFTKFEEGEVKVEDVTNRTEILSQLGYSIADNLTADLVILTEGPTDTPVITEFLTKEPFKLDAKYNIKTWSLGGDNMKHHDLTLFTEVIPSKRIIAVVDNEPDKKDLREEFQQKCEDLGISCQVLNRFSTESYFTIRALKETFNKYSPDFPRLETLTDCDLKTDISIGKQTGIPDKKIKKNNRRIAQEMTVDEIKGTDLYTFLEKVKEMCESL